MIRWRTILLTGLVAAPVAIVLAGVLGRDRTHNNQARVAVSATMSADEAALEALRQTGDLDGQRRHLWRVLAALTRTSSPGDLPPFMTWYGAADTFAAHPAAAPDSQSPARMFAVDEQTAQRGLLSSQPPLIVLAHYNPPAYFHIRRHVLQRQEALTAMSLPGKANANLAEANTVPAFPRTAIVLKSAWWPVAQDGVVAMPVWDPAGNPSLRGGNDYPSWKRVVAVCGTKVPQRRVAVEVELMGHASRLGACVGLDRFYHLDLDARMAEQLNDEPTARKLSAMVIGRPLRAGDSLALVALHVATRELPDWVWGTFWWHDHAPLGPYAATRPAEQQVPWRNYLMNVAFDAVRPREPDGSPRIVFNPWLEARFADDGQGGGTVSNCVSCHRRAAFPALLPFQVTRGTQLPAPAAGDATSVRTSSLWSVPLQAR